MAKKYVSKIKRGNNTLYVKDTEAREQLPSLATENAVRGIVTGYGNE